MPPDFKTAAEEYVQNSLDQVEKAAGSAFLDAILESSKPLDRFSLSMLIVVGAAVTLLLSNANAVVLVLGKGTFSWMLAVLTLSGLLGFVAKGCFTLADALLNMQRVLISSMEELFANYHETTEHHLAQFGTQPEVEPSRPSVERIVEYAISELPSVLQKSARKDPKKNHQSYYPWASSLISVQVCSMFGQAGLLVLAVFIALFGIE